MLFAASSPKLGPRGGRSVPPVPPGQRDGNAAARFYRRGENCARLFAYRHNCVLEFGKVSRVCLHVLIFFI